jgi:flagellar motor component MotA
MMIALNLFNQNHLLNFILMSLIDFYISGGVEYMHVMTIILLLNIALIIYVSVFNAQKKVIHDKWIETIKQLGGFALAWGAFSTLVGLFEAFGDLSTSQEVLPFQVIMGGLQVALITVLYGFCVFHFSIFAVIILRLTKKD